MGTSPKRFGKSCRKYICLVIDKSIICLKKELYRTKEGTGKSFSNLIGLEKVNKICHVSPRESRQSYSVENYDFDISMNKITLKKTNVTYHAHAIQLYDPHLSKQLSMLAHPLC